VTHGWGPLEPKGRRRKEIARIIRRKKKWFEGWRCTLYRGTRFLSASFPVSGSLARNRASSVISSGRRFSLNQIACLTTRRIPRVPPIPPKIETSGAARESRVDNPSASPRRGPRTESADPWDSPRTGGEGEGPREYSCGPVPGQIAGRNRSRMCGLVKVAKLPRARRSERERPDSPFPSLVFVEGATGIRQKTHRSATGHSNASL